jgi:ABC-type nitrate/sulfonate/bicarbonate transport system substrate-binding protein
MTGMTPLRIGAMSRTFFYVPLWAALDAGAFAKEGLDVTYTISDSATRATAALLDGSLDIAIAPPEGVIANLEKGGPLRIIAGSTTKLSHFLIAQSRFKRVEDLAGASIGCISPDEGSRFHFEEIGKVHGLKPGDYRLAPVGGAPTRWEKLKTGEIDAGLQSIPFNYMAEDAGFSNLGAAVDYIPDFQFTTYNVRLDWAERNRATVVAFLKVMLRYTAWTFENREAASVVAAREMHTSLDHACRAWDDFKRFDIMPSDLSLSERGLENAIGLMVRAGHLPEKSGRNIWSYCHLEFINAARALEHAA